MENEVDQPIVPSVNMRPDVSFPQQHTGNEGGMKKKIIWIIVLLVILGVIGAATWFMLQTPKVDETNPSPTPFVGLNSPPSPEATETPQPKKMDKKEVSIEILNGTGISGEAGFLKEKLVKAGYEKIEAANAGEQNKEKETSEVSFSSDLPEDIVKELTDLFKATYKDVNVKTAKLSGDIDVRITTGLRKNAATSKPSASPSASSSPKASPTATASPSPTSSPSGN